MKNLLVAVLFLASSVFAQTGAQVNGTVQDGSGLPVAGAAIALRGAGVYATATASDGHYSIAAVQNGVYVLTINASGFQGQTINQIQVDAARTRDIPAIRLTPATQGQTIDVVGHIENTVDVSNAEVSTTLTNEQLQALPILDRNPVSFLLTQPGITKNGRGSSTIHGLRAQLVNITLDGVNVQDNYIRIGGLDVIPNGLLLDQVAEMTATTSNASPSAFGGAGQAALVTPTGSDALHGSIYWWNRNSALAANTWFNNQAGALKPQLNENQPGVTVGGPVMRHKLFFYSNYEAYRNHQQQGQDATVLTASARNGLFTYQDAGGVTRQSNLLTIAGVAPDPVMAKLIAQEAPASAINNFNVGDSTPALLRNTAGYQFVKRNNETRDNATLRMDFLANARNSLSASVLWNRDLIDRPDLDTTFSTVPTITNQDNAKLLSLAWRWNPKASLTNELRFGFNLAPVAFATAQPTPDYYVTGMAFSDPEATFRAQGRNTNTYNLADNATWVHGRHTVQFGYQYQKTSIEVYNNAGITPTYTLGIGTGNHGLLAAQLPGISSSDLAAANTLLATLAGDIVSDSQTFNVASRSSGYVPGRGALTHYLLSDHAFYVNDAWRVARRLTVTAGLRWDDQTPVTERDGLVLMPLITGGDATQTLLSNATLGFSGGGTGRSFYRNDRNNFAPQAGFAWDIFGDGRTALRAGYSMAFVNDEVISAAVNIAATNRGLNNSTVTNTGLAGTLGSGVPAIGLPVFQIPRTFADNAATFGRANTQGAIDPNLSTPYVQQWNVGIEHSAKSILFAARYVGNHSTRLLREFDVNQVMIGAVLPDFLHAQQNGFLAQKATGSFNATYNPAIAGSVPLPYFNTLAGGGSLTNATIAGYIQTGQVGSLADNYYTSGLLGTAQPVYASPYGQAMNLLKNFGNGTYNGLELEANRRFAHGLQFQTNFTWSKALSNAAGTSSADFEPFLDVHNPSLERSREAAFDVARAFKANASYELPFGVRLSGIFGMQTGAPFSVTSGSRGTLNRGVRSTNNTATPLLSGGALQNLFGFYETGAGPYIIAASAIGPDGRGVASDGATPFSGQAFLNPGAGAVGALQRNYFNGPSIRSLDVSLAKTVRIRERASAELRVDAENVFNHPTFIVGDQSIDSTTFGKITATGTSLSQDRRLLTAGLTLRF